MGYTTEFEGQFKFDKPLKPTHAAYLAKFSEIRHMQRDVKVLENMSDPFRVAVGLPLGTDGEFFVGASGFMGQDKDLSVKEYNWCPKTQPGLWCQWVPGQNLSALEWDGGEKFYDYTEWLQYMVKNFFVPWGYTLNGEVKWFGEDRNDAGVICVKDNIIKTKKAVIKYEEDEDA